MQKRLLEIYETLCVLLDDCEVKLSSEGKIEIECCEGEKEEYSKKEDKIFKK